jgi:hypothetical protein
VVKELFGYMVNHFKIAKKMLKELFGYVVNHFKITKKMVKELLFYDASVLLKIMFSKGLAASLIWSSVQSSFENYCLYGVMVK